MKVTPYEWRKQTIAGFKTNLELWTKQRDSLNAQIDEALGLIKALESVEMKRPYTKKAETGKPKTGRKMSAKTKARLIAATKRRWAKRRKDNNRRKGVKLV